MTRAYARLALAAVLVAGCALDGLRAPVEGAPFLYRIEGEPESYLFGTIHVPDPRVLDLAPVVRGALAASAVLYTEAGLEPGARTNLASALGDREPLPPLRERLPEDLYLRLERYLALRGLPVRAFDHREIWAVAAALPLLDYLQAVQTQPVLDEYLVERAAEWGLRRGSLESVAEQVEIFQEIDPAGQVALLDATVTQLERDYEAGRSSIEQLVLAYLSGDERRLLTELAGDPDDPASRELMDRLLGDRSRTMAERMEILLAEEPGEPRFFAVGAGHLPGEGGIVALLRARGHQVQRIWR